MHQLGTFDHSFLTRCPDRCH